MNSSKCLTETEYNSAVFKIFFLKNKFCFLNRKQLWLVLGAVFMKFIL